MKIPAYIQNCIDLLECAGHSAYAVGGAVRDGLLGKEPSDWDVTTSALPDEILAVFSDFRTIPTGIKHGTVTVIVENEGKGMPIEITTFRIDGEYMDTRHPESVSFSRNIRDDLSRRDFTVNALAYNEKDGIIDAFGGVDDLKKGIIRAVGDPEKRFSEDALRILRAFRFSAQLGFVIEDATLDGTKKCAHLLKNIARERIGAEFKKLLLSQGVVYSLEKMIENGVWDEIFSVSAPDRELVSCINELSGGKFETRLAALISNHDDVKRSGIMESLRLSNNEKKLIERLCRAKTFEVGDDISRSARSFLHYYGDILPMASEIFRFFNSDLGGFLDTVQLENEQKRPLTISDLAVNGNDLLPLCGSNHRQVGLILKTLLERVLDDPTLNDKKKLIEIAKESLE